MKKQPLILLVDDDPDIIETMKAVLETRPYRLVSARDGQQCLARVQDEPPDLILLDMLMPRMDGFAVIRELRSDPRYTGIPIIVLTTVLEDAAYRRYELETGRSMDVQANRRREWRIEPSIDLVRTPVLQFSYRPESWLLLTRGRPPFVIAAGSSTVRRGEFPLDALVMQVRARYGKDWQPAPASLGAMQMAGGEAALSAFTPGHRRAWLLWAVLVLGALAIVVMVLRLLRAPPEP